MIGIPLIDPPIDDEEVRPFWEAFDRHEIVLPRCSACQRFQWYPDRTGPDCAGAEFEWITVPTTGSIHTMTRVHRAFLPGANEAVPFVVGFIDLDDVDGVRLVATLLDDRLEIGARVEATFIEHNGHTRPVFRVAA